jgi:tight adherence protein C
VTGALLGLAFGGGLVLIVSGWHRARHPALDLRIVPYLRDIRPSDDPTRRQGALGAILGPMFSAAARSVGNLVGGSASVQRRLVRLGGKTTLEEFRVRQLVWGCVGFTVAAVLATVIWSFRGGNVAALLVVCVVGFLLGVLGCDNRLSAAVRARENRMREEFPVVADLLALAVAAGEGPVAGIERILGAPIG